MDESDARGKAIYLDNVNSLALIQLTQLNMVPICRLQKDSRLGEPRAFIALLGVKPGISRLQVR